MYSLYFTMGIILEHGNYIKTQVKYINMNDALSERMGFYYL